MPSNRRVRVQTDDAAAIALIREGVTQIRAELGVSADFPPDVLAAAASAVAAPRLPQLDRTDLPMVTIDPEGARDLDQALHIERAEGGGYVVHYAIADVAAFVAPGDPIDLEAHRRGETLYGADSKVPLHPPLISEDAASLVPDQVRPALLWTIAVDRSGEGTDVRVERALVRSREQLSYEEAQRRLDSPEDGSASEVLELLREVGELRMARDAARGGVSLPLPEQVIDAEGGEWHLEFRSLLPVEEWNSQISLLTGFGAATLMIYARVGILRTLPPPDPRDVQRLHRVAAALGVAWPAETIYPDFVRALDPRRPDHAAVIVASARLLRGSGYVAFDGEVPAEPQHAALASEYAHVTAPLRRLGDRYAGEVCLAICAGTAVPDWVLAALPALPGELQRSAQRARSYERAVIDLAEAALLASHVGEEFDAVVVSVREKEPTTGAAVVAALGLEAPLSSAGDPLPLGTAVRVRLASADVATRQVTLTLV
ncbi:RNB domain-containing ribonuclease [Nocardioides sp. R-C-SC26]|uniref:RNB domain-containing ribonuclease n=1 Tax=Nocardioides sp. R-C-SC26 TaxID=2870414 RepID=UPI001E4650AF|nr:RNB domain-containing ribonuclease [Nocardioides sp. R-C-SC26]